MPAFAVPASAALPRAAMRTGMALPAWLVHRGKIGFRDNDKREDAFFASSRSRMDIGALCFAESLK